MPKSGSMLRICNTLQRRIAFPLTKLFCRSGNCAPRIRKPEFNDRKRADPQPFATFPCFDRALPAVQEGGRLAKKLDMRHAKRPARGTWRSRLTISGIRRKQYQLLPRRANIPNYIKKMGLAPIFCLFFGFVRLGGRLGGFGHG